MSQGRRNKKASTREYRASTLEKRAITSRVPKRIGRFWDHGESLSQTKRGTEAAAKCKKSRETLARRRKKAPISMPMKTAMANTGWGRVVMASLES